ncbi:HNH endonuclease signature motif containing protein [Williamsia sterculiae]|uniref:HNH endonuclease n=1 Tax=Williamsia sterculiae TaxID=1344003 RepID=A0A1N7F7N3_9NOCA|nr:HNH endonuclease signature motif containing protein [Williamsia sterculiae]SIR96368.1 HNH endonuclease [Williamsia sterculiae]
MDAKMLADIGDQLVDAFTADGRVADDTDADIIDAIGGAVRLRAVTDHVLAVLAAQAERVGVAKRSGMTARELLVANGLAPVAAGRCLRVGRALSELPSLQRYSSNGFLSGEHVDAVVRGVAHVSTRTRTKQPVGSEAIVDLQTTLVGQAISGASPAELMALARAVAIEAAPDDEGIPAAEDATVNEMSWHQSDDGRLQGTFDLDVPTGERLICAVDTASRPRPLPDGTPDPRSAGRRRADAFGQLLDCAARAAADDAAVRAPRTEVVVTVPVADRSTARLGWLGSISDRAAKLAGCDAGITRVDLDHHGVPTAVSATKRLFTGAVRKAIIVRDQCCVKCGAPASWTDCHHIVHHADGGPTILDNGSLLCRSCHTAVHHQGWDVIIGHDRHP